MFSFLFVSRTECHDRACASAEGVKIRNPAFFMALGFSEQDQIWVNDVLWCAEDDFFWNRTSLKK